MEKYKIRAKEIKNKMKQIKELLKRDLSPEEKEIVEVSLVSYLGILNLNSNTQLLNFIDEITNGKSMQYIFRKYDCVTESVIPNFNRSDYLDDRYLSFLLELIDNIAISYAEEEKFSYIDISEEQMMKMSKLFFESLEDSDISKYYNQIIETPNSIAITPHVRNGYNSIGGMAFFDHLYNKPYITTYKSNNINDFYVLSHEIMHGIDFHMNPKLYSKTYYGFHETSTYAIEYLISDFLEQMGIEKTEIEKLRREKEKYISVLAGQVQLEIRKRLRQNGINVNNGYTIDDIKTILDLDLLKKMLEVESGIMAYGFYQQIIFDKQQGLENLKKFMSSNIPKDRAPEFSSYGLSNEKLIELSHQMVLEQQNQLQLNNPRTRRLVKPSINNHAFIKSSFLVIIISIISILFAIFLITITR